MRDFTIKIYQELLDSLLEKGYHFQTFREFLRQPASRTVMLRHDVDDRNDHSYRFAEIQREKGIVGTYYFRMVPQSFDKKMIKAIHDMGHEVGYHYEDMDFAKGDPKLALEYFKKHLRELRELVPIETICMHGSPRSAFDNKDVWKEYDYKSFGIIGEPYFDLDFKRIFYLTDTGRRWDGDKVSVRDKVTPHFDLSFHHTHDIIQSIRHNQLPDQVMINFHPQRWTDNPVLWQQERVVQTVKNAIKYVLIKMRKTG